ncbi:DUF4142 domain-containing protein [Acetobacter senegalensis]|nr:DUF4142 domain-containing protein [Acetobacter senegalensis]
MSPSDQYIALNSRLISSFLSKQTASLILPSLSLPSIMGFSKRRLPPKDSRTKRPVWPKENLLIMLVLSRRKALACSPLLVTLFALSACISPGQPPAAPLPALEKAAPFTSADADFVQKLNDMDLTHIALANIAKTHAARNDIALLSTTIVKELTENHDTLTKLATTHTLTLPAKPSAQSQKVIDQLQHLHGSAFDRSYTRYFMTSTTKMKSVLEAQITTSKNTDLVKLATDTKTKLTTYQSEIK